MIHIKKHSGNIPIFNIPGTLFANIPGISKGTFSEYSGNISWKCSTNIARTYIMPGGSEEAQNCNKLFENFKKPRLHIDKEFYYFAQNKVQKLIFNKKNVYLENIINECIECKLNRKNYGKP